MIKKFNFLCYGIIFPTVLSFISYFGFGSKYTQVHASLDKLPDLYYQRLYNYRFLSRDILTFIYEHTNAYLESLRQYHLFKPMNTIGTNFYLLTVLYNTIFYILSCMTLYKLLSIYENKSQKKSYLLYLFLIFIISISQYVITPFDNVSIFLFFLSIIIIFKLEKKFTIKDNIILTLIIIISTCNRESSALTLSFYATILLNSSFKKVFNKDKFNHLLKHLSLPVLGFLLTYIGIRLSMPTDKAQIVEGNYFISNFTEIKNVLGLLFYLILTYFSYSLAKSREQRQHVSNYILFSLPYILIIIYAGILWEIRLYIPLLMGQFILSSCKSLLKYEQ